MNKVLIEKTSKTLKIQILLSSAIVFLGLLIAIFSMFHGNLRIAISGLFILVIGTIWRTIVGGIIWWQHS